MNNAYIIDKNAHSVKTSTTMKWNYLIPYHHPQENTDSRIVT